MHDPAEFTSFISSGYGTRPTSTLGTEEEKNEIEVENVDASGIINSLQLDIPELAPILSNSPKRTVTASATGSRPKMTDLGLQNVQNDHEQQ